MPAASDRTPVLYLPPQRLRRYQFAKAAAALVFACMFTGWLLLQRSNAIMLMLCAGLLAVTAVVFVRSFISDRNQARRGQLAVDGPLLRVSTSECTISVELSRIAGAGWCDDPPDHAGLHLLDVRGECVVHLGVDLLADAAEARAFVGWLHRIAGLAVAVRRCPAGMPIPRPATAMPRPHTRPS